MKFFKRLKSALFSGNSAAYLGLFVLLVGPLTRFWDKLIRSNKIEDDDVCPPCMMIVGQSRSGSTIISQVLVRSITCAHVSNKHLLSPIGATKKVWKHRDKLVKSGNFNNYYGYTSSWYDVAEGNELLDEIYAGNPGQQELRKRFIRFVKRMGAKEGKPLIFKNVKHYYHLNELFRAVPELKILRTERSLEQMGQSALKAYHELGYYNPIPESIKNVPQNDPAEYAAIQVSAMNEAIEDQLKEVVSDRIKRISYESFCAAPWEHIKDISLYFFNMNEEILDQRVLKYPLKASSRRKVTEEEAEKIKVAIEAYHNKK